VGGVARFGGIFDFCCTLKKSYFWENLLHSNKNLTFQFYYKTCLHRKSSGSLDTCLAQNCTPEIYSDSADILSILHYPIYKRTHCVWDPIEYSNPTFDLNAFKFRSNNVSVSSQPVMPSIRCKRSRFLIPNLQYPIYKFLIYNILYTSS